MRAVLHSPTQRQGEVSASLPPTQQHLSTGRQSQVACLSEAPCMCSTEPWFELPYVTASIPTGLLQEWDGAGSNVCPELDLPPRNDFIPTDFSLRCEEAPRAAGGVSPDLRGPKRQKQASSGVCVCEQHGTFSYV